MNIKEINVFGGGLEQDPPENEFDDNFEDLDCPIIGLIEGMYVEPHPYGVTLSIEDSEELLKAIGYRITTKDGTKYALMSGEKVSRSPEKRREQHVLSVYRRVAAELAKKKFLKDWNELHTGGTTPEA